MCTLRDLQELFAMLVWPRLRFARDLFTCRSHETPVFTLIFSQRFFLRSIFAAIMLLKLARTAEALFKIQNHFFVWHLIMVLVNVSPLNVNCGLM